MIDISEGMNNKRKSDDSSLVATMKKRKIEDDRKTIDLFNGLSFYILKAGIENARFNIFQHQIQQNGGLIQKKYSSDYNISHIIVDDKMEIERMLRLLGVTHFPDNVTVVKTQWLSLCLKSKKLIDSCSYQLRQNIPNSFIHKENVITDDKVQKASESNEQQETINLISQTGSTTKSHLYSRHKKGEAELYSDSGSDYEASDDEMKTSGADLNVESISNVYQTKHIPADKWVCAQSSLNPKPNSNKHITDKLEEMVKAYTSTNDKWRSYGYQKCIRALMKHPNPISSWEEANALPGVGSRLADKIWEIVQSGELRKLNEFKSSEEVRTLELFNNVWGAGPHTAQVWFQQGFRSIEDLQSKAKLTNQQKVGVRLYDELLDRMPREEAGRIADVVREAAEAIQPGIIAQACGSYRRGKPTCGDVDVLVTHPDGKSHRGVFGKLLDKLHETGFLTDDLVSSEDNGNQKKYLGVCKLPGEDTKHRRLDIIVVPYHEYACAVMYFTGSAHFNRSLRLLCKRQDMSLSEHALRGGVIRQGGERVHEGAIIPTPTEESVFKILKIPYRPPEERDH